MDIEHFKCCGNCKHLCIYKFHIDDCLSGIYVERCDLSLNGPYRSNAVCGKWEFDKLDIFERLKKIK